MVSAIELIQGAKHAEVVSKRQVQDIIQRGGTELNPRMHSGAAVPITSRDISGAVSLAAPIAFLPKVAIGTTKALAANLALPKAKSVFSATLGRIFGGTLKQRFGKAFMGLGAFTLADYAATGQAPIPTPRKVAGFVSAALNPISAAFGATSGLVSQGAKAAELKLMYAKENIATRNYWDNYFKQFDRNQQGFSTAANDNGFNWKDYAPKLPQSLYPAAPSSVVLNFPATPQGLGAAYSPSVNINPSVGSMGPDLSLLAIMLGLGLGGGYLLGRKKRKKRKKKKANK